MNISTVVVLIVIFTAVAFAIRNMVKNGDTCACGCKNCGRCEKCCH
ncbi:MAG: FeoB-associated Cys-rich membrane protein [Lachnospiraceae bacterium]|nr:FeoB-associated Cys-rich membrane protein [Lachnospiraceae bacterium]